MTDDRDRQFTYAELLSQVQDAASALREKCVALTESVQALEANTAERIAVDAAEAEARIQGDADEAAALNAAIAAETQARSDADAALQSQITVISSSLVSGVTAGTYGPTLDASPAHGGTFTVPYLLVNAKGKVTEAKNVTITLPTVPVVTGYCSYCSYCSYCEQCNCR